MFTGSELSDTTFMADEAMICGESNRSQFSNVPPEIQNGYPYVQMSVMGRTYSWVQFGGPVTTESIVRFDTWLDLFEVFRKNLAPMTLAKMTAEFVRSQNPKWPPVAILEM